jgi:glycosyltransferase involved in cell wall biosynthesis/SAM-dependent methyltransferase
MRIAFFSPLPPTRSGIADYSAALLDPLSKIVRVDTFDRKPEHFDPSQYDIAVYQLGNNPHHEFAYEGALQHPGVVVMHEANLHHLIAHLTIVRGDWDAYLKEIEFDAGAEAHQYAAEFVRTIKRPPDYDIPMLKRVLANSRAAIVHSGAVESELRGQGFAAPVGKIPHGAWLLDGDRLAYRTRLGLTEATPLAGIFGFLKPYKRIAESLRAFRRLIRVIPDAKMILVGEAHPELPLADMIRSLGLSANVRHIGFAPIEDFNGYMSACDVVLNLRYPTVGESSGTLLRALGLGKAVVVSNVGSFGEYPDEICVKAPVDASEDDHIFEYLNLLFARPDVAQALGARARRWVEKECSWESVARRYGDFLEAVVEGKEWPPPAPLPEEQAETEAVPQPEAAPEPVSAPEPVAVPAEYIAGWTEPGESARGYVETHMTRLERTLAITPPGSAGDRILEMGAYLHITPALKTKLGYGEVRGCYYGPAGTVDHRAVTSETGEAFACDIDLFDAERDPFPYPDGYFSTILCCELIEHLPSDPIQMMMEINRVLKPGGHLVLTTPNITSLRAVAGILQGFHPMLFPAYIRPRESGEVEARHAREYSPNEIKALLSVSGFEVTLLETGPFREAPTPELSWVEHLLDRYILPREHRGDGIYAVGKKTGPVKERYPSWLYA